MTGRRVATALLALLLLMATVVGGAEAGSRITGRHIKDGTVTGKDLRDQSVTGLDIADRALTADDVAGPVTGPAGPAGRVGDAGTMGPAGRPGVSGVVHRSSPTARIYLNQYHVWTVACPGESWALGGGLAQLSVSSDLVTTASAPTDNGTGWRVSVTNFGDAVSAYAWVVCARA